MIDVHGATAGRGVPSHLIYPAGPPGPSFRSAATDRWGCSAGQGPRGGRGRQAGRQAARPRACPVTATPPGRAHGGHGTSRAGGRRHAKLPAATCAGLSGSANVWWWTGGGRRLPCTLGKRRRRRRRRGQITASGVGGGGIYLTPREVWHGRSRQDRAWCIVRRPVRVRASTQPRP
jgi:hypothetical protein